MARWWWRINSDPASRSGRAKTAYLIDAAVALALTVVSIPPVTAAGRATVLRWPADTPRPDLPNVAKADLPAAAVELGYRIVPMQPVTWLWWTCTGLLIAGLLIQRRWPLLALILAVVGGAGHYLGLYPPVGAFLMRAGPPAAGLLPIDLAVPLTLLTLASRAKTRWAAAVACASVLAAAYTLHLLDDVFTLATSGTDRPSIFGLPAVAGAVVVFAVSDSIRSHRSHQLALHDAATRVEREQERAALVIASERAQITRELHDVVAHSLAIMVAQAQAAVAAQHAQPGRATTAMLEVVKVGRVALTEMRRMLSALRSTPAAEVEFAPQPGLQALAGLFNRVRAAGIEVRLRVDGAPVPLPAAVDLSAYRIVQEALTNAVKHAGTGAQATVSLAYRPEHVDIEICDDGGGEPAGPPSGSGNGLRGIAERVDLLGGELTAGPAQERGFRVHARLPLEAVTA